MRASEILRKMADLLDAKEGGESGTEVTNRPDIVDVEVDQPTDTAGIEGAAQVNVKTMVPPLQQKLDLMKKLAGIDNGNIEVGGEETCCPECGCEPCECGSEEPEQDELAIIKQNAGIKPAVIAIADEDEPFEG